MPQEDAVWLLVPSGITSGKLYSPQYSPALVGQWYISGAYCLKVNFHRSFCFFITYELFVLENH